MGQGELVRQWIRAYLRMTILSEFEKKKKYNQRLANETIGAVVVEFSRGVGPKKSHLVVKHQTRAA
jgi:hypothetical protein